MMHRLPDGTVTDSKEKWATTWNALAVLVAARFPGYRIYGMDPDVVLIGEYHPGERPDMITLSVNACNALLQGAR